MKHLFFTLIALTGMSAVGGNIVIKQGSTNVCQGAITAAVLYYGKYNLAPKTGNTIVVDGKDPVQHKGCRCQLGMDNVANPAGTLELIRDKGFHFACTSDIVGITSTGVDVKVNPALANQTAAVSK